MQKLPWLVVALSLALSPRWAVGGDSPWYVTGSAGAYLREDKSGPTTFTNNVGSSPGTERQTFDFGPIVNLGAGYKLPDHFRIEAELGYAHYDADALYPSSSLNPNLNGSRFARESGGDFYRYMATVNGFYDLPIEGRLVPYIGGGLGFVHGRDSEGHYVSATGAGLNERGVERDTGVALLEAGVTIALDESWSLAPAYRYLHYVINASHFGDETAHVFKLGLRYSF